MGWNEVPKHDVGPSFLFFALDSKKILLLLLLLFSTSFLFFLSSAQVEPSLSSCRFVAG